MKNSSKDIIKYEVIGRNCFIGREILLWNITDKSKREYIEFYIPYGFHEGQIITNKDFVMHEGKAMHPNAYKKQLFHKSPIVNHKK